MNNQTTYVTFSAIDYRGLDSLSSYALENTPLIFKIDESDYTIGNILWDFGDGTIFRGLSASKVYKYPGQYNVNILVYDCFNTAKVSTYNRTITIKDYLVDTFYVKAYRYVVTEDGNYIISEKGDKILSPIDVLQIPVGEIFGPIGLTYKSPWYINPSESFYTISNGDCVDYWDLNQNKFNHLKYYNSLYEKKYNNALSSYEYIEIDKIDPIYTPKYVKIDNGNIVSCLSSDSDSVFAGWIGEKNVYLKNDKVVNNLNLKIWKDKTNIPDLESSKVNSHSNNMSLVLSAKIIENTPTHLSITSNGMDGEGMMLGSFNIHPVKYFDVKIPIVVKFKDVNNFTIKHQPSSLSSYSFTVNKYYYENLLDENGEEILTEDGYPLISYDETQTIPTSCYNLTINYSLSSDTYGNFFKGYLNFPKLSNLENLENLFITCNYSLSTGSISGQSSYFSVYNTNQWDLYKINEDFNAKNTLYDITFQETIRESESLYNDFFSSALGSEEYDHDTIGVRLYEKIANFNSNINDIDTCNLEYLRSNAKLVNYKNPIVYYNSPNKIKEVLDLASINKTSLLGYQNKYSTNLNPRGRVNKTEYGKNLGDIINTETYVVEAGNHIVAYEKFSNKYTLLNTYQPLSTTLSNTYPLSAYNSDWGWPLVLPSDYTFDKLKNYYDFYEYVGNYENNVVGGVVDFSNEKNTVTPSSTYKDLYSNNGFFENLFVETLYDSLSLVK